MPRIFISYRRDDSIGHAGRLHDRLSDHLGDDQVFMDIDDIQSGKDWVKVIENAVGSCDVLIALIGKQWLTITDAKERRRLDDPKDFVRLEIATALKRDILVIPVLVRGATMPRSQDLPTPLKKLVSHNPLQLSDSRFRPDVNRLIEVLLYNTLQRRLQNKQWRDADLESIRIIQHVSGHTCIDSKEKAQAIPAEVLYRMNELWSDESGKPLKDRRWVKSKDEGVTSYTGFFSLKTWLEKRLEEVD